MDNLFNFQNSQSRRANHLLVVDDSPDNLFLLEMMLQGAGYETRTAEDGVEALAKIEEFPPDLVLLDVMMPGMNGYEVTKRIRENSNLPFIPILLVTACENSLSLQKSEAKADALIHKPVELDQLMRQVNSLLALKESVEPKRKHDSLVKQ